MKNTYKHTEDFISKIDYFFKCSKNISNMEAAHSLYGSSGYGVALWANFIKDYTVPRRLRDLDPEKWHLERCAFYTKPDLHIICLTAIFLGMLSHDEADGKYQKEINLTPSELQNRIKPLFKYKEILKNTYLQKKHPEYISYLRAINNNPIDKPEYQVIRAVSYLAKKFGITPIEFDRVMYLYGSFNFSGLNDHDHAPQQAGAQSRYIDLSKFIRDSDDDSIWDNTKKLVIKKIESHNLYSQLKDRRNLNFHHLIEYVYYEYESYRKRLEDDNRINEANLYLHYIHNRFASGANIGPAKAFFENNKDIVVKLLKENTSPEEKVIKILNRLLHLAQDQNKDSDLINSFEYDCLLAIFKNNQNEDSRKSLQGFYEKHKQNSLLYARSIKLDEIPSFEIALEDPKKYKAWLDKFSDGKQKPQHPIWGREFCRSSASLALTGNLVHFFEIYNLKFSSDHNKLYDFLIS